MKYCIQYNSNFCGIIITCFLITDIPKIMKPILNSWPATKVVACWKIKLKS